MTEKPNFQKMTKYWFELMSLYSFSRRIRISSPNRPKIDPGADFDQFSKNLIFSKISKNRQAAASAGGLAAAGLAAGPLPLPFTFYLLPLPFT